MRNLIEKIFNAKKEEKTKYAKNSRNVANNKLIERTFKENPSLEELSDNYILLTNPELVGTAKTEYEAKLKQDIVDFVENKPEEAKEYNMDNMASLAYFRLQKVSKQYCLQKLYEDNKEIISKLREEAKRYTNEYELAACLR